MTERNGQDITRWLERLREGDASAHARVLEALYGDLRRIASEKMRAQRAGHTLQATALVHEAWIRLAAAPAHDYRDREHFLAVAARAMRQVLVDHARARTADKREGGASLEPVALDTLVGAFERGELDILALHQALEDLAVLDPVAENIVVFRFFGGMSMDEIASHLRVPKRTVERDWEAARAWLRRRMK
jgi:RNA polymerase sigma factor (TIGR02999 family)